VSHRSVRSGARAHTIGEHRQRAFQVESDQDALERSDRRLGIVERASMIPDGLPQDLHATPAILSGCDGLLDGWGAHRWRWRHVRVELWRRDGCMVLVLMLVLRHGVKRCALRGWGLRGILNRTLLLFLMPPPLIKRINIREDEGVTILLIPRAIERLAGSMG